MEYPLTGARRRSDYSEKENGSHRHSRGFASLTEAVWDGQAHLTTPTLSNINSGASCPGIDSFFISSRGSVAKCCTTRTSLYWNPVTGNVDDLPPRSPETRQPAV